jgi:hypothetical protein
MKSSNPGAVLALLMAAEVVRAFTPSKRWTNSNTAVVVSTPAMGSRSSSLTYSHVDVASPFLSKSMQCRYQPPSTKNTALKMASEDFMESKYTEAAWSGIQALSKVAEYYQATTVDAPHLLDVMLNPSKHNAGEDAEAARKVVEKCLIKAGADVKELRSELEQWLGKQARIQDPATSQKNMGRTLEKVLETARIGKSVLGVRC